MAPAPAGPPSVPSPLARLLLGVVGETARMEGLQGARGHCNPPHNELGYDDGRFFLPGGGAANPPTNPEPFRQSLDLLGWFVLFATLGFSSRFHVGRPLWLLLFLASFLACCLPYPLLSWVLPFLGFVRKRLLRWSLVLVDLFCGHLLLVLLLKTGQNAVRFCFLVFAWVRPVLAFRKIPL